MVSKIIEIQQAGWLTWEKYLRGYNELVKSHVWKIESIQFKKCEISVSASSRNQWKLNWRKAIALKKSYTTWNIT